VEDICSNAIKQIEILQNVRTRALTVLCLFVLSYRPETHPKLATAIFCVCVRKCVFVCVWVCVSV